MNLITFNEIIRLLRAKDLGLMTEDAVANQILKYRELETRTTANSPISVTSSNEHSVDIVEAFSKLTQRLEDKKKDDRVMIVEFSTEGKRLREGLINDDGSVEWVRKFNKEPQL